MNLQLAGVSDSLELAVAWAECNNELYIQCSAHSVAWNVASLGGWLRLALSFLSAKHLHVS
jgi:hypothetical protein